MALGLGGVAAATVPVLGACGVGGRTNAPNGADDVTGGFDWKKASGTTINILQTPHPYQKSYQPLFKEFTELTGINVNADLVPEADYFTKLNTELAGGTLVKFTHGACLRAYLPDPQVVEPTLGRSSE